MNRHEFTRLRRTFRVLRREPFTQGYRFLADQFPDVAGTIYTIANGFYRWSDEARYERYLDLTLGSKWVPDFDLVSFVDF